MCNQCNYPYLHKELMIMIETCTFFNLCALHRNFQLRQRSNGVSCVNVAIAFGNGGECSTSDLTKRSPKSEMKKGIKLPKRELNSSLVALIDAG